MSKINRGKVRIFQLGSDILIAEILTQNDKRAVIRYPLLVLRGAKGGTRLLTPFWYEVSEDEIFVINHWSLRHVIQTRPDPKLLDVYEKLANQRPVKKGQEVLDPTDQEKKPVLKLLKFNKSETENT